MHPLCKSALQNRLSFSCESPPSSELDDNNDPDGNGSALSLHNELEILSKRYMICVGRKDKKAFWLETTDKRAFPASEEHLLSTL
uniref:Uncharacterized protein n=1 Tax=Romanomermis culicivorax TaxID=13658 RepID=A0A915K5C3_ROMCU